METKAAPIFLGETPQQRSAGIVKGEFTSLLGDTFYKIHNYDSMDPFFMSIVSSSNHWLFISSTGGLSAGRASAEQSLFPYYTEDKITENNENTGGKSIFLVTRRARTSLWEPFSDRHKGIYRTERNLYKNVTGTALVFEEHNFSLGLAFRYAWRTGDTFGFIKSAWLMNSGDTPCQVELLDGLQNILPANITSLAQNTFSPLLDAYKRSELDPKTGLAIFALSSTLTDLPEPSESLLAVSAMHVGLENAGYLISSTQLESFRTGLRVTTETEIRGRRCAYFIHAALDLAAGEEKAWHLAADVGQDCAAIVRLQNRLSGDQSKLAEAIEADIQLNDLSLERIVASADGLQISNDALCTAHHFANVMFNVMRGGFFSNGYVIQTQDFIDFVTVRSRDSVSRHLAFFSGLPAEINILDLHARAEASGQPDLVRLGYGYLPLTFSRRHGDPSRPWNRFSIDIKKADGSLKLGYEGNWRDIFQNWEALACSYPEYVEGMISTFLNATTVDGYNPYRITRAGLDWEIPEPGNPWSNIGYWSDHQVIYLQKLLEISTKVHPGRLERLLSHPVFSYANVPYRIRPYADLLANPYNTIEFSWELQHEIDERVRTYGSDGRLLQANNGNILHANLTEKLLTLLLAKLVNFVPEGGIWMNTQRPEWNDANNALVGKGLSVVTLCYLRRMIVSFSDLLRRSGLESVPVSIEIAQFLSRVFQALQEFEPYLAGAFSDQGRRWLMDALGQAGSDYRWNYYCSSLSGEQAQLDIAGLRSFLDLVQRYVEHSLHANKRPDNLFHAYNILHLGQGQAGISRLYEMLEGQVAILSSGMLSGEESLSLLESLRNSALYQAAQHSYVLYPDRALPGFVEKNRLTPEQVSGLPLLIELVKANDRSLIVQDEAGSFHFSGGIRNIKDVTSALNALPAQFAALVEHDAPRVQTLFESIFHHNEFTGRSGTFFAYEGLGSIYWHMVSKLLLSVQETLLRTRDSSCRSGLLEAYAGIRKGLGFNKPPEIYGAFPTDPYSHTPSGQGARQPGMTGMVKEEILARQIELGFSIEGGCIAFDFLLFDRQEFLKSPRTFDYWSVDGRKDHIRCPAGSLIYSICQVPVILQSSNEPYIHVHLSGGNIREIPGHVLDAATSRNIFRRDGMLHHLVVGVPDQSGS